MTLSLASRWRDSEGEYAFQSGSSLVCGWNLLLISGRATQFDSTAVVHYEIRSAQCTTIYRRCRRSSPGMRYDSEEGGVGTNWNASTPLDGRGVLSSMLILMGL